MSQTSAASVAFHADISRIDRYAPAELIGREAETKLLSDAWDMAVRGETKRPRVLAFVALGGEGKTSLVAKWAAELAHQDWPGCDAAFAWSFYSQGTREQTAASSDVFLKEALTVFGDAAMASSAQSAFDKGRRLAQLVGERQALLILDGLEPLQYAPTSPTPGELKDQGLAALLKGLAATNHGLCVVTTRYSIPDLRAYWQTTAPEMKLLRLSQEAGVALLRSLGVKGTQKEFETLVEDVDGHALTLNLLGGFLKRAFKGDIRQRDRVKFEKADAKVQGRHAFRTMAAYEKWLLEGDDEGRREVAILRLMGLFDRPADSGCLAALRSESIPDLTEAIVGLDDDDWEFSLTGLEEAKLLTVNRDPAGTLLSLDAHPLLREYFARQLRTQHPEAWRAAHRRLYEHLCATTTDKKPQPTLEDLQPLYQAVAHGCQAGLAQAVFSQVLLPRVFREEQQYSFRRLAAVGPDLQAIRWFFEAPWHRVRSDLAPDTQRKVAGFASRRLLALGRFTEAKEAAVLADKLTPAVEEGIEAPTSLVHLCEVQLLLGSLDEAADTGRRALQARPTKAEQKWTAVAEAMFADVLHQKGDRESADGHFQSAEEAQKAAEPERGRLYTLRGFQFCDFLMTYAEAQAWSQQLGLGPDGMQHSTLERLRCVLKRAQEALAWQAQMPPSDVPIMDSPLHHLTLGRAALYVAIIETAWIDGPRKPLNSGEEPSPRETHSPDLSNTCPHVIAAVDGLRHAATTQHLPRALLTRAWLRSLSGDVADARADLDEAWEIAERGPMPLFLADIHLHRARLFHAVTPYPWESPRADLAVARRLIEKHGYWRRKEELKDAEAAAGNW